MKKPTNKLLDFDKISLALSLAQWQIEDNDLNKKFLSIRGLSEQQLIT